jgi:putative Mg2+ transporter-C (MgtC) family protein
LVPRLGEALTLGSLIGAERQWRHHMAGLQTNALVAVGAASFVLISVQAADPSGVDRIAAQVASGVGFLGAGVIMRQGLNIHGLNTAATLWCSAATGALAGCGAAVPALLAAVAVVVANLLLHPLVGLINRRPLPLSADSESDAAYLVSLTCEREDEPRFRALLLRGAGDLTLRGLHSRRLGDGSRLELTATFLSVGHDHQAVEAMVAGLSAEPGLASVHWRLGRRDETPT